MKSIALSISIFFISLGCYAQYWQGELLVGTAGYSGDLSKGGLSFGTVRPSVAGNLKYEFNDRFTARGGLWFGVIGATDKGNTDTIHSYRNLNFGTKIYEASVALEFNLLSPDLFDIYPYVFAGAGIFHFSPYAYDDKNQKVYLWPLNTEGQGLPEYPDRKPYSKFQLCIPFGGGIKKSISDKLDIALEVGFRKLFTDYLDDVSTSYVDPAILLQHKGALAVEMADRDVRGPRPVGFERGNPSHKDWYYFTSFKLTYTLGGRSERDQPELERRKY